MAFDGEELFTDVSFFLSKASYTYVCGNTNTGKTTLLRMISGELFPDSGTLVVNDMELHNLTADQLPFLRRQIGFIESNPLLLDNRSVADNIRLPLEIAGFDRRAMRERMTGALDEFGLAVIEDVQVSSLTFDQRWLVTCARATIHRPVVLLIDEPAATISKATAERLQEKSEQMATEGTTVLACRTEPPEAADTLLLEQGMALHNEFTAATGSHQ